jgi:hypothetical protein
VTNKTVNKLTPGPNIIGIVRSSIPGLVECMQFDWKIIIKGSDFSTGMIEIDIQYQKNSTGQDGTQQEKK